MEDKKYQAFLPEIPTFNTKLPQLQTSLEFIEKNYPVDANTTVIGHSLGCILALRLAEKYVYKKMILVAGWDYDDLTEEHKSFWPNKINHAKIRENVKEIYCVTSDNDPYTTLFNVEAMNKRLGGKLIVIKHRGHFGSNEKCKQIPQLLSLI